MRQLASKGPMGLGKKRFAQEERAIAPRRSRIWNWFRRTVLFALIVGVSGIVGGFLVFADQVGRAVPPIAPRADAIVALTGGPYRLNDAVDLLASGSAKKLLISGVNEQTTEEQLISRLPNSASFFQCCIDIGYSARDTRGNAAESREWARQNGFRSLIVVTSAYHIPRSMAELKRAMPDVDLIAYPVHSPDTNLRNWLNDYTVFRMLLTEYSKYLFARLGWH